jgi:hypothetical protein
MTPQLSHNVLPDLTSRPSADNPSAAFSQLRFSLIKVLRNSPESREPICDALELIEALQQQVESKRNPDVASAPAAAPTRAGGRRSSDARDASTASLQEHFVQTTHEGEFLTERRPSGSQPFRCPRDAYDAAARVLEEADQPLHFDDLLDRLNTAMGQRQADYRLRVCLRFWVARNAVERFRTRYRVTPHDAPFSARAQSLWEAARHT